jgi:hypothetical protein
VRLVALRVGVLAGVALIAVLVAVALVNHFDSSQAQKKRTVTAVPAPGTSWNDVRAGILALTKKGKKTACGVAIGVTTFGVAHPSLPCGTRIFIAYGDIQVARPDAGTGGQAEHQRRDRRPLALRSLAGDAALQ